MIVILTVSLSNYKKEKLHSTTVIFSFILNVHTHWNHGYDFDKFTSTHQLCLNMHIGTYMLKKHCVHAFALCLWSTVSWDVMPYILYFGEFHIAWCLLDCWHHAMCKHQVLLCITVSWWCPLLQRGLLKHVLCSEHAHSSSETIGGSVVWSVRYKAIWREQVRPEARGCWAQKYYISRRT
jgi:hypothetical protein